jgi:hypothetical protein
MKKRKVFSIIISLALLNYGCRNSESMPHTTFTFELNKIAAANSISTLTNSEIFSGKVLNCVVNDSVNKLVITDGVQKINWTNAKYLVCDVYHSNDYSAIIYIDFYKKSASLDSGNIVQQGGQSLYGEIEKPRISPKIGILPKITTRLIFPLSYLDGQQIFMSRFPRQLKGSVMGRRLDLSDIGKVILRIEPVASPDFLTKIEIAGIYLTDSVPQPLPELREPVVDEFGQWTVKNWEGKTLSESELKDNLSKLEKISEGASFPEDWSKYGGWKQKQFQATGFFRTHNDGKRWWLVDPEGFAFLSAGIDCVRPNAGGLVSGQEDMFSWLPEKDDTLFSEAFSRRRDENTLFDFAKSNLIRVYGTEWRKKWESITTGLLKEWRVNTIANWSDEEYTKNARLPYVLDMTDFPTTKTLLYRDFPDVFSKEYLEHSIEFAKQLESVKNDEYLIGYFLSNEPHWAFGDNNLAFEMLATNTFSDTKLEFANWLNNQYAGSISDFNLAWKQNFKDFKEISGLILKESPSEKCWNDCNEFSGVMVDQYVKLVCDEVKKIDNNHLNLGMRYAWISSELCYRAGAYFDVFSINGYTNPGPPETAEISRRSGKPVLIGEYHFGSIDRGLPANGIQGAENQNARGESYRYYLEQGFARPELIGIHYFQWIDQPVFGRFDGENYNIGFLDICMHPYNELTDQAKLSHEKMYKVANGDEKPFDIIIRKTPQIFY